jgi:hypothetical protein
VKQYRNPRNGHLYHECSTPGCKLFVSVHSASGLCLKCTQRVENASPRDDLTQGKRNDLAHVRKKKRGNGRCRCHVCGASFFLAPYQDARWTWYCPACRQRMALITVGAQWQRRMGIPIEEASDVGQEETRSIRKEMAEAELL